MSFSVSTKVFIISTLAVPISYVLNTLLLKSELNITSVQIAIVSFFVLTLVYLLILFQTHSKLPTKKNHERIGFFLFSLFSFISVINLITALELDGLITGFISAYLKYGEPHLRSSYGTMLSYYNGTLVYAMHLMMIAAITWGNDFSEVALFWFGSSLNSMVVIILSIASGKLGFNSCTIFYFLHLIFALIVIEQRLKHQCHHNKLIDEFVSISILKRPGDLFFILYLVASIVICLIRGLASFSEKNFFFEFYVKQFEPYITLENPAPFPKMQMLVYLFYFVPYYVVSIYLLFYDLKSFWISTSSIIHAGASFQAQFTHIGSSLHSRTPFIQRVPQNIKAQIIFWSVNCLLLLGPQLLTYRFTKDVSKSKKG